MDDEPWTPMTLDLRSPHDRERLHTTRLRIVEVGPESAEDWTRVHWSSFRGTPYDDDSQARFVARWTEIMTGPFADRAHSLIAYDTSHTPVAVTTVWTGARGLGTPRPGRADGSPSRPSPARLCGCDHPSLARTPFRNSVRHPQPSSPRTRVARVRLRGRQQLSLRRSCCGTGSFASRTW